MESRHEVQTSLRLFVIVNREEGFCIIFSARITIEACSGLAYEYSLTVDGKSLEKFQENKNKTCKSWAFTLDGEEYRVVLGKLFSQRR